MGEKNVFRCELAGNGLGEGGENSTQETISINAVFALLLASNPLECLTTYCLVCSFQRSQVHGKPTETNTSQAHFPPAVTLPLPVQCL